MNGNNPKAKLYKLIMPGKKRFLLMFCTTYLAASFILMKFLPGNTVSLVIIVSGVGFVAAAVTVILKKGLMLPIALILAGVMFAGLTVYCYNQFTYDKAIEFNGERVTALGEVAESKIGLQRSGRYVIKVREINGDKVKPFKVSVYIRWDEEKEVHLSDRVVTECVLKVFEDKVTDGFNENVYMKSKGVYLYAEDCGNSVLYRNKAAMKPLYYYADRIRSYVAESLERYMPDNVSGIAIAMLTGDKSAVGSIEKLHFKRSGMLNIMAVSGMHLVMFSTLLHLASGLITNSKKKRATVAIAGTLIYMIITGMTGSVVRAGIMFIAACIGKMLDRESDSLISLTLALTLMIAISPEMIFDVGLALSFSATLGIVLFSDGISGLSARICFGKKRLPIMIASASKGVLTVILYSVAANLFIFPALLVFFGSIQPLSVLSSLMSSIFVQGVFYTSIFTVIFSPIAFAASVFGYICAAFCKILYRVTELVSSLPYSSINVKHHAGTVIWVMVAFFAVMVGIGLFKVVLKKYEEKANKKRVFAWTYSAIAAVVVLSISMSVYTYTDPIRDSNSLPLRVVFINVGQGDCALMIKDKKAVVIDCGSFDGEYAAAKLMDELLDNGINEIDTVFLSHYHSDHSNGLVHLMNEMKIRQVVLPDYDDTDGNVKEEITELAREKSIKTERVMYDMYFSVFDNVMIKTVIDYLPPESMRNVRVQKSVVTLVSFGSAKILFTADVEKADELTLAKYGREMDVDLLKVGHHGSKTSSTQEFISQTSPQVSVISVGYNNFGHPDNDVINRLTEAGSEVYRTDECGNITADVYASGVIIMS